ATAWDARAPAVRSCTCAWRRPRSKGRRARRCPAPRPPWRRARRSAPCAAPARAPQTPAYTATRRAARACARRAPRSPPRCSRAAEAVVHVDVTGSGRVFASEAALAGALVARAAALGVPAAAGVAGSRPVAELAARDAARRDGPGATRLLAPGADADFLAPL